MKTWKDLSASLPNLSIAAQEEIRRLTAPVRHAERVKAALAAALSWVLARLPALEGEGSIAEAYAHALCWAEARGLYGGGFGNPGAGTTRHPAFRECGAGRRNAGDGRAWTAAIAAAAWVDGMDGDGRGWSIDCRPSAEGVRVGHEGCVAWTAIDDLLAPDERIIFYRGLITEVTAKVPDSLADPVRDAEVKTEYLLLLTALAEGLDRALRLCPWTDPAHGMECTRIMGPCKTAPTEPCCYCRLPEQVEG